MENQIENKKQRRERERQETAARMAAGQPATEPTAEELEQAENMQTEAPEPAIDLTDPAQVFGAIRFTLPKGANKPLTYNDGRIQHNLADAQVEIGQTGMFLKGRVVAVVAPNSRQASVEFKFLTTGGAQFRVSVVEYADAESRARADEWRVSAVKAFQIWKQNNKTAPVKPGRVVNAGVVADLSDLGIS